ncbi:hypothetical protein J2X31_002850 [Flavobacterium arsenatis]|uniref:Uncharacterized protein n=1 Tax=Flavobacterium arsenatis TaxID=1484332 RepID=A0ABU1TSI9_9FLAO|nr:hypothetical protein [Flavobacterium arsenatis]MDR6968824.1 hypothetical protein [Flavobacterium arsenatis]
MQSGLFSIIICSLFIGDTAYAQTNSSLVQSKQNEMKQFSLLVRVPENYGTLEAKKANPEWDKLLEHWKKEGVYILSFAFPGESYTLSGVEKKIRKETVLSGNLKVVSHIVLQTETIGQALELAKSCPILLYGGMVEVREIPKPLNLTSK